MLLVTKLPSSCVAAVAASGCVAAVLAVSRPVYLEVGCKGDAAAALCDAGRPCRTVHVPALQAAAQLG